MSNMRYMYSFASFAKLQEDIQNPVLDGWSSKWDRGQKGRDTSSAIAGYDIEAIRRNRQSIRKKLNSYAFTDPMFEGTPYQQEVLKEIKELREDITGRKKSLQKVAGLYSEKPYHVKNRQRLLNEWNASVEENAKKGLAEVYENAHQEALKAVDNLENRKIINQMYRNATNTPETAIVPYQPTQPTAKSEVKKPSKIVPERPKIVSNRDIEQKRQAFESALQGMNRSVDNAVAANKNYTRSSGKFPTGLVLGGAALAGLGTAGLTYLATRKKTEDQTLNASYMCKIVTFKLNK